MPENRNLENLQKIAAVVAIIAYILMYYSVTLSERVQGEPGSQIFPPGSPDPSKVSATSAWLRVITLALLTYIGIKRLQEVQSLPDVLNRPAFKIAVGAILGFIGIIILAIGAQQRADQPGNVTVLI